MTTSPRNAAGVRRDRRGFSLTEVIIAATLGSIILGGVLSTMLMLVKSGIRLENYVEMETQTRRAFEVMGIDARMASNFQANFVNSTFTSFTLTIPEDDLSATYTVTYGYDGTSGDYTFYRIGTTGVRQNLISHCTAVTILRYDTAYTLLTGTDSSSIKHIQVSVNVSRSKVGQAAIATATQFIRSSAFTIRNISI